MSGLAQRVVGNLAAALTAAALAVGLQWSGVVAPIDRAAWDLLAGWRAPSAAPDVVLVAIDESSLLRVGRWPWPRRRQAELVERLAQAGPAVIVLDLILAEPDLGDLAGDAALADAIGIAGNVVLPVYRSWLSGERGDVLPFAKLRAAARALGHAELAVDEDGRVRRFDLIAGDHRALSVVVVALADGGMHRLPERALLPAVARTAAVRRLSAADVLDATPEPGDLKGAIVYVGVTASGLAASVRLSGAATPVPAALAQVAAIGALRDKAVVGELPTLPLLGLTAALAFFGTLLAVTRRPGLAGLATAVMLAPAASAAGVLGVAQYLPPAAPAAAIGAVWAAGELLRRVVERRLLQAERRRAEATLRAIADAVVTSDGRGLVDYVNAAAERLLGIPAAVILGRPLSEVLCLAQDGTGTPLGWPQQGVTPAWLSLRQPVSLTLVDAQGQQRPVRVTAAELCRERGASGLVLVLSDMTVERALLKEISHRAMHDTLTGLPNRDLIRDRLTSALARARRSERAVALILLDLDRFKAVNDALGHAAGDALLVAVARRLRASCRECDSVGRLGGDEFVLVLEGIRDGHEVLTAAQRYVQALRPAFEVEGHTLHVAASFGLTLFPHDGDDPERLFKNADMAMYRAKAEQRGGVVFYAEEMNVQAVERLALERELRRAIEQGQFELHYQPQLRLDAPRVVGAEGLIRWRHPQRGLLSPAAFLSVAEETGLICDIGRQVLACACRQLVSWQRLDPELRVCVNVSVRQLKADDGFVDFVERIIGEMALGPGRLELEVTESLFLDPALEVLARRLRALSLLGVRLSIDDFGTGYSSLAYLRGFPFDRIKIDRSFVRDVENDAQARAIVGAIIDLAHSLQRPVTAEGVETEAQRQFLVQCGCDEAQGFLFGRPERPESLEPRLGARGTRTDPSLAG